MKERYFILLNGKCIKSCVKPKKAYTLFEEVCKQCNSKCDIVQLYEVGFGIIDEY